VTKTVHVVDDDDSFLRSMGRRLRGHGYTVETYRSVADFLLRPNPQAPGCVLTDLQMPHRDGFELQDRLTESSNPLPVVFVTGKGDIRTSVRAIKAGAEDFLTKRVSNDELLQAIERALTRCDQERTAKRQRQEARAKIAALTPREKQMLLGIVRGVPIRDYAEEIGVSERTVKHYRTLLTRELGLTAAVDLARLVQDAGLTVEQLAEMAEG
jgi:FixJ family two-component response regulator